MANANQQTFESLRVVGGLLGSKVLQDIRQYALPGQSKGDYGVETGLAFNDELGRFWKIARGRWQDFQQQRQRADVDLGQLTVDDWLLPLLERVLDYDISRHTQKQVIGEREFPISHSAFGVTVPLVLCSEECDLDKSAPLFGQEGRRRSPMGLAQEYLNACDDSLWALVSNGLVIRLLRDNPAMTRPAYVEVDFVRLFEEDNYADFATLWLLLHASRLRPRDGLPDHCWVEQWREKSHDEGERALDKLRYGVAEALRQLGTGFVAHPANSGLRQKLSDEQLSVDSYFQQVLRLVYRFLFLLTAEDRDIALLPREFEGEDFHTARGLYQSGYSLSTLRDKARQRRHYDQHNDGWQMLGITFNGFARGQPLLAQPALGGLFADEQCEDLVISQIENRYIYSALFNLGYFEHNGVLSRINYRDMDTEEFGSVYESLLELIPQLHTEGHWRFSFIGDAEDETTASGHSRKLTGSYYTPDSLVQELIKSALEPVIEDRLASNPENPRQVLLSITVCDPACGSGHFLLAAARRLAGELAQIDAGSDQPTEAHFRHAMRDVVRRCIYGVDLNPLAVELCKTGLWLESIEPGKPLSFLDAHIQCGNALVGILKTEQLENGIPGDAYKPLSGDDKAVCRQLKKRNAQEVKQGASGSKLAISLRTIPQDFDQIDAMPEDTVAQVDAKRQAFTEARSSYSYQNDRLKEDLFTAAFFAPKTKETAGHIPTNAHLRLAAEGQNVPQAVLELTRSLSHTHRFLHWPLAFPQAFGVDAPGGFDVMLGNPPWDVSQMGEEEYFSTRAPWIAELPGARRKAAIEELAESNPRLFQRYVSDKQGIEGLNLFVRRCGRYNLTAVGKLNLYSLFAECFSTSINNKGRAGIIVPTGIATDDSNKLFFASLAEESRLVSLYDFENRRKIFSAVDSRIKFCLMTVGSTLEPANLAFYLTETNQLTDKRRTFSLSPDEFQLINPNTRTCPVFRTERDAEITRKMYQAAPVLIREGDDDHRELNPWNLRFSQGLFNMTSASHLFVDFENYLESEVKQQLMPMYEAKMIHHYDHRWATFELDGKTSRDCTLAEKQDPAYQNRPRYWVPENEVTLRTAKAPKSVIYACKKQDHDALTIALRAWCAGVALSRNDHESAASLLGEPVLGNAGDDLFGGHPTDTAQTALTMQQDYPLSDTESAKLQEALDQAEVLWTYTWILLEARRPRYLLGWRDICRATDERTVIAGVIPLCGVGNNMPIILIAQPSAVDSALLQANLSSLVFDFVARHKVGGTHLNFFIIKQLPVLDSSSFNDTHINFIIPRVLELTYTSKDLKPFAEDLGHYGQPFPFDPERRHQLKSELDAYYARLYGLTKDELRYILDPADVMGDNYPSETFRVLKNKEMKEFGEYRTRRLVLEAWDKLHDGTLG